MITISKDGSGDYTSITEALSNVTATPETIYIRNGIYEECVEVLKPNLTFIGEDVDKTVYYTLLKSICQQYFIKFARSCELSFTYQSSL